MYRSNLARRHPGGVESQGWNFLVEGRIARAKERGIGRIYQSSARTLEGCLGALDPLWDSVRRRCDSLDQGRHRLWVSSVRGDLLVRVGQEEGLDGNQTRSGAAMILAPPLTEVVSLRFPHNHRIYRHDGAHSRRFGWPKKTK